MGRQRKSQLHVELYRGGGEHRHGVRFLRRRQKEAVDLPHPIPARRAGRGDRQGDLECGGVHGRMRLHRRTDGGPDPRRGNGGGTASAPAVGERLGRLLWGDGKVLVLPCLYRGRHGIGGTLQQLPAERGAHGTAPAGFVPGDSAPSDPASGGEHDLL